jgi:hypothetical protein
MAETQKSESSLVEEFRHLGQNLIEVLHAAWDSPERKRLQQEIGEGLSDLAVTLRQEVQVFQESPTGQRLREDVEDLRQRIRSGEAEAQVRGELLTALQRVNSELAKAAERWSTTASQEEVASLPAEAETGAGPEEEA